MTETAESALMRRRALMTWVVSLLRFHVEAGDRDGQHRLCRILRGLELAGDPEVLVQTARLADLLRQETLLLRVMGSA